MCYNSMRHQLFLGLGIETGDIIQSSMVWYSGGVGTLGIICIKPPEKATKCERH